eukprot:g10969.t1
MLQSSFKRQTSQASLNLFKTCSSPTGLFTKTLRVNNLLKTRRYMIKDYTYHTHPPSPDYPARYLWYLIKRSSRGSPSHRGLNKFR